MRWFVCRDGWWSTPAHPARHTFAELPGQEAEIYYCLRCTYEIGF